MAMAALAKSFVNKADHQSDHKKDDKKKPKKKAYEADGSHIHNDENELGLHNHPEIERIMMENFRFLAERVEALENNDSSLNLSSDSKIKKTKGDTMAEENIEKKIDNVEVSETPTLEKSEEVKETVKADEEVKPASAEEAPKEAKADVELAKKVDELTKEIAAMKKSAVYKGDHMTEEKNDNLDKKDSKVPKGMMPVLNL